MASNLKEFVQKFIEQGQKATFPNIYIVDKQTGPYRKIQDAIDAAEPQSLIKISQGFYEQKLVIKKAIRLEPKTADEHKQKIGVVLIVACGIAMHINMEDPESHCHIQGILCIIKAQKQATVAIHSQVSSKS